MSICKGLTGMYGLSQIQIWAIISLGEYFVIVEGPLASRT